MNRKNVNSSLKSRVRFYLDFLSQEQKNRDKQAEDKILNILSNKLRDEITEEINSRILNKFTLFSANFSYKIMKEIVFLMKEVQVSPNEIIFQEDDIDDQSIYFIQNGIVEIYVNTISRITSSQLILAQLTSNNMFGEISFFSGLGRKASARSKNLSTIYKINRQDFINLLQTNEEDFERFKMIQEQIIFQQNYKCLYIQCYSCQQLGHLAANCPKTHINFDRQFITLKYNYSSFQKRNQIQIVRKIKKKFKPKDLLSSNQIDCKNLKCIYKKFNTYTAFVYGTQASDEVLNQADDNDDGEEDDDEGISENTIDKQNQQGENEGDIHQNKDYLISSLYNEIFEPKYQQQMNQKSQQKIDFNSLSNIKQFNKYTDTQNKFELTTNKDESQKYLISLSPLLTKKKDDDIFSQINNEIITSQMSNTDYAINQIERLEIQSPDLYLKDFQGGTSDSPKSKFIKGLNQSKNSQFQIDQSDKNTMNNNKLNENEKPQENKKVRKKTLIQKQLQQPTSSKSISDQQLETFSNYVAALPQRNFDLFMNLNNVAQSNKHINIYGNYQDKINNDNFIGQKPPGMSQHQYEQQLSYQPQSSIEKNIKQDTQIPIQLHKNYMRGDKETSYDSKSIQRNSIRNRTLLMANQTPRKQHIKSQFGELGQLQWNENLLRLFQNTRNQNRFNMYDENGSIDNLHMNQKQVMNYFESMKSYNKFFPQNNYDKVLLQVRLLNKKRKKQQRQYTKMKKIQITQSKRLFSKENQELYKNNGFSFDEYNPTYASYGVCLNQDNIFPCKFK